MKRSVIVFIATAVLMLLNEAIAQESYWSKPDSLFKFVQPSASLQLWSTYSMHEKAQLTPNGALLPVDDRISFMARRARLGFKGKPYKRLSYVLTIQYDNLGKDKFSSVRGGTNAGTLGILDAFVTWQATKNDMVNITTGYFQPQFSRECITGDLVVNSLDKSPSQTYIRQHITGKNYGRTAGVNVGGMKTKGRITVGYNAGIFNNNTTAADQKNMAESTGILWSPLMVERVMFTIGDPEMKSYSINYDANNYYSKRKGVTLSVYSSQQGKTDIFSTNRSTGFDMLLNFKNLNLDGEWNFMERHVEGTIYNMRTGHIRAGYNVVVANKYFLEPSFMVMDFTGDEGAQFSGHDRMYDAGVNWYLNKKSCKLSAHYIWQEGHGNNGYTDGVTFQKGNFAALAFVLMI